MDENPNATAAYAVCIYGIEQDTDSSGKTMGLTFGPALGADYTNASVSHEVNAKGNIADSDAGKTQSGNAYRCVHCDNRETIIEWNTKDPYVYEQCLEKGCTHKLELDFSQASMESFRNSFVFTGSGDGPIVLSGSFSTELSPKIFMMTRTLWMRTFLPGEQRISFGAPPSTSTAAGQGRGFAPC